MNTGNTFTIPISGTGSAGMEAAFVNLVEPGDKVLILLNGVFGTRMQDVAGRLGGNVDVLEFAWGTPVELEAAEKKIRQDSYKIVAVVHAETSTGVRNPVAEIGAILKGSDTIYLVDTVTSLGGLEVRMDDWNIDALYSGAERSAAQRINRFILFVRSCKTLTGRNSTGSTGVLDHPVNKILYYFHPPNM